MDGIQEAPMSGVAPSASPIILIEKRCTKCGEAKPLTEFYNDKRTSDGKNYWCKACSVVAAKAYQKAHPEQRREACRRWIKANPEQNRERARRWYKAHPEQDRKRSLRWQKANPEQCRKKVRRWIKANPEKAKESRRRADKKIRSAPKGKLNHNIGGAICTSLNSSKAGRHWEALVNYTIDQLKQHLEKQFKDGMTWENYGKWHVDHIIPKVVFNFNKPEDEDFKRCWSLKNLQPMWAKENMRKSNKLNAHFQPRLIF